MPTVLRTGPYRFYFYESLRAIKFIRDNPKSKHRTVSCAEHGEQTLVIVDNGPEPILSITGCCEAAINEIQMIALTTMPHERVSAHRVLAFLLTVAHDRQPGRRNGVIKVVAEKRGQAAR